MNWLATPGLRRALEREFPQGAAEFNGGDVSRRHFMKIMGASTALAGVGLAGLPASGDAPRAVYQERGVGHSREVSFLYQFDALGAGLCAAHRLDVRGPADEDRGKPVSSRSMPGTAAPTFTPRRRY